MSPDNQHTSSVTNLPSRELIPFDHSGRTRIEQYKEQYRAQEIARQEIRAELAGASSPDLAAFTQTLEDELAAEIPEKRWAVRNLASAGSIVTLPSSRKTGKTTFLANLAMSGVGGESFLGEFETFLTGTVAVVNAEMGTEDYRETYRALKIREAKKIRLLHCRESGIRINLMNDVTAQRFTDWLTGNDAQWLFLDPWKNFLAWSGTKMNDNDAASMLITRVQEIHSAAGLTLTVIPMHTTQTAQEAGYERAKGAGEVEDSADALWRYTRSKGYRNSTRVLAVEGRGGAGLDETTVLFDPETGRLTLGEGDRKTAEAERISMAIVVYVKENPGLSQDQIVTAMHDVGHPRDKVREILGNLRATGIITTKKGPHNATLHYAE